MLKNGIFSWKPSIGIINIRQQIIRSIGICFTKSGRQRKIGKLFTGGGHQLNSFRFIVIGLMFVLILACDPIPSATVRPTETMTNFEKTGTANAISYWATKTAQPTPTSMPTKKLSAFEKCEQSGSGVRLVVDGNNVTAVSLTWQNDTNGTEQGDYEVPFCVPYLNFSSGDFLYISAQIILPTTGAGTITCKIYDGDEIIARANASGFPNIATCSTNKP